MAFPKPLLFALGLFAHAGLADYVTSAAHAQLQKGDLNLVLCQGLAEFNKRNDLAPCNRLVTDAGSYPLRQAMFMEMRARAYTIRGFFDLAIRDYNTILSLWKRYEPKDRRIATTLAARGRAYELKGDFNAAEMDYKQMLGDPQYAYHGRQLLEILDKRRSGKQEGPFSDRLYEKQELDREDLRRVLLNNTIFAATARGAEPWRAYFGADGSMAIVYANGKRKNGRWAMDSDRAVCIALDGASQACRTVAKMVLYAYRSSTYFLWVDAKSGEVTSHIFEARPGKFIDRVE